MKNKICFCKILFFRKFFDQNKNLLFFGKFQNSPNFRFSIFRILWIFEIFRKNIFVFWSIFFEKTKFSKTHFIFHFVCIMSLRCQISKSADRFENSLRCLQQKKRTFIPEISTRHPFQTLVKAMSSESKMTPPKWSFFKVRFVWRHRKPL